MGCGLGFLHISLLKKKRKRETFYLMGVPRLNRDWIKMKFSVQSIMVKPCEPDSLASREVSLIGGLGHGHSGSVRLKAGQNLLCVISIFTISPLNLLLTGITLTLIIWSHTFMFRIPHSASLILHSAVLIQPLQPIVFPTQSFFFFFFFFKWTLTLNCTLSIAHAL